MNITFKFCAIFVFVIFITEPLLSQDPGKNFFQLLEYLNSNKENVCTNLGANWPENKTSFPYPTPGPINIITSLARNLTTLTPLKFNSDPFQTSIATNTGKSCK